MSVLTKAHRGSRTAGATLHRPHQYDLLSRLLGLGVDRPKSRMAVELAPVKRGDVVLELGCGTGSLALTAASHAEPDGKVHGIDAAAEMIAVARRRAARLRRPAVFDVGLAEDVPFAADTFDVVLARLVLHHLPEKERRLSLDQALRVLKPGGCFVVVDFRPPAHLVWGPLVRAVMRSHMRSFDVWSLPSMMASAGFAEIESGPTPSAFLAFVRGKKPMVAGNAPR